MLEACAARLCPALHVALKVRAFWWAGGQPLLLSSMAKQPTKGHAFAISQMRAGPET